MKRIKILLFISGMFFSCASTSPTFGELKTYSASDVKIFTDKFSGSKTYEYTKGLRGGFAFSRQGLTADYLHFYPHFIITEDNICLPTFKIEYTGSTGTFAATGANKSYKKFIFLSDDKKIEISPIIEANKEAKSSLSGYSKYYTITTNYSTEYFMQITKNQFDMLADFFSNANTVECAAYTVDNKVIKFKSYNNKWHQNVFKSLDVCVKKENPNVIYNNDFTQAIIK